MVYNFVSQCLGEEVDNWLFFLSFKNYLWSNKIQLENGRLQKLVVIFFKISM